MAGSKQHLKPRVLPGNCGNDSVIKQETGKAAKETNEWFDWFSVSKVIAIEIYIYLYSTEIKIYQRLK